MLFPSHHARVGEVAAAPLPAPLCTDSLSTTKYTLAHCLPHLYIPTRQRDSAPACQCAIAPIQHRHANTAMCRHTKAPKHQQTNVPMCCANTFILSHGTRISRYFLSGRNFLSQEKLMQNSASKLPGVTSGSDPRITRNVDMRRTSEVEPDG